MQRNKEACSACLQHILIGNATFQLAGCEHSLCKTCAFSVDAAKCPVCGIFSSMVREVSHGTSDARITLKLKYGKVLYQLLPSSSDVSYLHEELSKCFQLQNIKLIRKGKVLHANDTIQDGDTLQMLGTRSGSQVSQSIARDPEEDRSTPTLGAAAPDTSEPSSGRALPPNSASDRLKDWLEDWIRFLFTLIYLYFDSLVRGEKYAFSSSSLSGGAPAQGQDSVHPDPPTPSTTGPPVPGQPQTIFIDPDNIPDTPPAPFIAPGLVRRGWAQRIDPAGEEGEERHRSQGDD